MPITAKIVLDSVAPSGIRLTTFELMYPRFIHSELMTHRAFSRNAASSRAIPIEKMLERVQKNPAMPVFWAANQKGMQAVAEVNDTITAEALWRGACDDAVRWSRRMAEEGLHKAIANRITEPFQHMVTLVSATDWGNFFHLRYHKDAQQEFQVLAKLMYGFYRRSKPLLLPEGAVHMPYIRREDKREVFNTISLDGAGTMDVLDEMVTKELMKISVGRCARTSYVNQDGVRALKDDIALHDRLVATPESGDPGHWSPFEHVARAETSPAQVGNYRGWTQYRKLFVNENRLTIPDLPLD